MLKLKACLLSLLLLAITAVSVMAEDNDAKTENENAANTTSTEGSPTTAGSSLTSNAGDASVRALLGVLVSKGVLTAEEAKSLSGTPVQQNARLVELLR